MSPWIEPMGEAVKAASAAYKIATSSEFIKLQSQRLIHRIKHGKCQIIIFGAGGVGKSTVGSAIVRSDFLAGSTEYEESMLPENMALPGKVPGNILIVPGQIERANRHWPQIIATKIVNGRSNGIINVVSYGFASFSIQTFKEHDLYEDGMSASDFINIYTSYRREIEIDLLIKLIDGLKGMQGSMWMVTLVNKQDLWWSDKNKVIEHYTNGKYGQLIAELQHTVGKLNFQHEYIPVSLLLGNFSTPSGEQLSLTTAGYDLACHFRYMHSFLKKLYELIGEEKT